MSHWQESDVFVARDCSSAVNIHSLTFYYQLKWRTNLPGRNFSCKHLPPPPSTWWICPSFGLKPNTTKYKYLFVELCNTCNEQSKKLVTEFELNKEKLLEDKKENIQHTIEILLEELMEIESYRVKTNYCFFKCYFEKKKILLNKH